MKRIICTICLLVVLGAGCAGRKAYPVARYQIDDSFRTRRTMELEIAQNEVVIAKKLKHDKTKFWSNFFWFIWFTPAMDFKEAEKIEAEALQARNNYLRILIVEKEHERGLIGYRATTEYPSGEIITTPVYKADNK